MRVIILHDPVDAGAAPDALDTLAQRDAVAKALRRPGRVVRCLPAGLDLPALAKALRRFRPDAAFNLVESPGGHDRLLAIVPTFLETLGLPYAGAPADALMVASDKARAKRDMRRAGLPTPDWWDGESGAPPFRTGDRVIVKSRWNHASMGMGPDSVFRLGKSPRAELAGKLAAFRAREGHPALAERFVDGREFNISLCEGASGAPEAFPPAEMRFKDFADRPRIVDYAAKWREDSAAYQNTERSFALRPRDGTLARRLVRWSLAAWKLWALRGCARMDFRVDEAGRPWLLEMNPNPCLAPDAGFAAAAARHGLSYGELIERLLERALPAGYTDRHISL